MNICRAQKRPNLPNTANPETKEYNESAKAMIVAFLKAGSSRWQCEPYAVIIPNVMLREKKTWVTCRISWQYMNNERTKCHHGMWEVSSKSYSFDPNLWIIDKHTPIAFEIPGNSVLTSLESDSPPKEDEQQNEGKTCIEKCELSAPKQL